jgi:hypothetical protein
MLLPSPEDGGSGFLRRDGSNIPYYTESHPRRHEQMDALHPALRCMQGTGFPIVSIRCWGEFVCLSSGMR